MARLLRNRKAEALQFLPLGSVLLPRRLVLVRRVGGRSNATRNRLRFPARRRTWIDQSTFGSVVTTGLPDMQLFVHDPRVKLELTGTPSEVFVPEPPYWFGKKARDNDFPLPREYPARLDHCSGRPARFDSLASRQCKRSDRDGRSVYFRWQRAAGIAGRFASKPNAISALPVSRDRADSETGRSRSVFLHRNANRADFARPMDSASRIADERNRGSSRCQRATCGRWSGHGWSRSATHVFRSSWRTLHNQPV